MNLKQVYWINECNALGKVANWTKSSLMGTSLSMFASWYTMANILIRKGDIIIKNFNGFVNNQRLKNNILNGRHLVWTFNMHKTNILVFWNPKWDINCVIPLPPPSQKNIKKMISTWNIEFFPSLPPHLK